MTYLDMLRASAAKYKTIACMGLDPEIQAIPKQYESRGISGVPHFFETIFLEMKQQKVFPSAFKPNQGYYVRHDKPYERDFKGSLALVSVMEMLKKMFPDIPIILDFKRGDIAKSSANYASEGFEAWKADAVTLSPYMGTDSVSPFADFCSASKRKGVYILNRTSNPGAKDFQDLVVNENINQRVMYMQVAQKIAEWAKDHPGVGAVVGATFPDELSDLAKLYAEHQVPLLIPGVGGQGGSATEVIKKLSIAEYDLNLARINSSSGLTHPWAKQKQSAPNNFASVCVEELAKLNEEIRKAS